MSRTRDYIEQWLAERSHQKFPDDPRLRLIYERGYIMAIMAKMADDDSLVRELLRNTLKQKK
jgi:hypothetical protein